MKVSRQRSVVSLTLCAMLLALCVSAEAQQAKKVPRIGALLSGSSSTTAHYIEAFRQGLGELGYAEGRNITVEYRWAEGRSDRFSDFAADLVRAKVDLIFAGGTTAVTAAKRATGTIPIVFVGVGDPVGTGGGNITGMTNISAELSAKHLELLKEIVPGLIRAAVLRNPVNPASNSQLRETQTAAKALGVQLQVVEVRDPKEFESAFSEMMRERARALIVLADPVFLSRARQISDLAAKNRLPAVFNVGQYVEVGGLMAYGPSLVDSFRRAAIFVDKILKGTKPADLPVEQPIKFELVINLKTAKQIGLTIPSMVLARADRVIR
ncbi:MAG TPA: ABC transporter substrate-binding protein [Candidatus Binatia bacterium]|nr:ABC transporter substrate-binding protein [Candidatus Binatia bacterium]